MSKNEKIKDVDPKAGEKMGQAFKEATESAMKVVENKIKKAALKGAEEFGDNFRGGLQTSLDILAGHHKETGKVMGGDAGVAWAKAAEGAAQGLIGSAELASVGKALLDALGDEIPKELKKAIEGAIEGLELSEMKKEFESAAQEGINSALSGLPSNAFTKMIGIDKGIADGSKAFAEKFSKKGAEAGQFIAKNWKMALGLALVGALIGALSKATSDLGDKFGAIGTTTMKTDLMDANAEMMKMGMNSQDLQETVHTLSGEFGVSGDAALAMAGSVADTSKALALSASEGSKIVGLLMTTSGLSAEQAQNFMKGTEMMARMNGVAPGIVMKDIANSSEEVAMFTKDGGENIAQAAVQARKFGVSIGTVAKAAKGLLNFQDSLNAELEASIMLGKNINLQKARELALQGDLAGVAQEISRIVGGQAEWERMGVLEREALANAVGMSVEELSKFISLQGKSNEELKRTTDYDISKVVGDEAIGNVQELANSMEVAKMQILSLVAGVANLFGIFGDLPPVMQAINLALVAFGGYLLWTVGRTLAQAAANKILSKTVKDLDKAQKKAGGKKGKGGGFLKSLTKISPTSMLKGAAALVVLALAVATMGWALQQFADVTWTQVAMGLVSIVVLAAVAALLGYFAPVTIAGAFAVLILAAAVAVLGGAFILFGVASQLFIPFFDYLLENGIALYINLLALSLIFNYLTISFLFFGLSAVLFVPWLLLFAGALYILSLALNNFVPFMESLVTLGSEIAGPLKEFAMALGMLVPPLLAIAFTQLLWFPAMVLLSYGMALLAIAGKMLGVALFVIAASLTTFNEQMGILIGNLSAIEEATLGMTAFAGSMFLLAAAFAAVAITGAMALPILMGAGMIGGALLMGVAGGAAAAGGDKEGTTTKDLYDQLVLMNGRLETLEENFEKNWVPRIEQSNVDGATKGAKEQNRGLLQNLGF
tara:strand:- start:7371 stop:10205 length:2835 start_codon:yes stop_codon:yes gene_type:complete